MGKFLAFLFLALLAALPAAARSPEQRAAALSAFPPPAYDFNFAQQVLDARLTFAGANTRWCQGSTGAFTLLGSNVPCYEFNVGAQYPNVPNGFLGVRVEASKTVNDLHDRDLSTGWVLVTMTAAHASTGIDGVANSATRLTASSTAATALQTIVQTSAAQCFSAFVRRVTGTGAISMTQDGTTFTDVTSLINGTTYTRVPVAGVCATLANPIVGFKIATSADAIDVDFAQNELGASGNTAFAPSSPVATVAATVTRGNDQLTCAVANCPYNPAAGTVVIEATEPSTLGGAVVFFQIDDGSTANRIKLQQNSSTALASAVTVSSGATATGASVTVPAGLTGFWRAAVSYLRSNLTTAVNGRTNSVSNSNLPVGITTVRLGNLSGPSSYPSGWIRRFTYWPVALPLAPIINRGL